MTRKEYFERLQDALDTGRITVEAYDASVMNADIFCDDDEPDYYDPEYNNLPEGYAEIEYSDFNNPEAIYGSRWDDMNYSHYMER